MTDDGSTVRFKVAPEVRDLEFLADVQAAMPLVPDDVEDCCARLIERTDVDTREEVRKYIIFCQALKLVGETPRGYNRRQVNPDREGVADAYRRRVFGVRELLDALDTAGDVGMTVDNAFEEFRYSVPQWERERLVDWEDEWRRRVERLLEWAVVFGLLERCDDAYRLSESN